MRIAMGSDHAGFELKEAMKAYLHERTREVLDVGIFSREPLDHQDCAAAVGAALRDDRAERGIIVCGSGVGVSIAANKIPGIRAGLCHDTFSAHQGVEHDDMNVLVLGGRVVGIELARELIDAFLGAHFSGEERHRRRLAKIITLENPLQALQVFGQSVWLDSLRRSLLTSGELRRLIDEDGVRGVTSNPAIFEKAIAGSSDYTEALRASGRGVADAKTLYEQLAIRDIQDAADALRPVYVDSHTRDGYVSLEVSPLLAGDTGGTLDEARRLWRSVHRDNLMIKVPATAQGIAAIPTLIAEGINVNATLLFTTEAYRQVADAYLTGLETLVAGGGDPSRVASVASFFVSRIDTAIDTLVAERLETTADARAQRLLRGVNGKVAVANARLAYQAYREMVSTRRWQALADRGAQTQRLLWASTGTKNPNQRDVLYLEELIGPDTVTTVPEATLDAFRDHGRPRASLTDDVEAACDTIETLADAGISLKAVGDTLLGDGVRLFREAFEKLLRAVDKQRVPVRADRARGLTSALPGALAAAVTRSLTEWRDQAKVRRLWGRDASLWTGTDEGRWLGWLDVANDQIAHGQRLPRIGELARSSGFTHVLLLGMGGSSLAPEVMRVTFGARDGYPALQVLDSTDPAQVRACADRVDLTKTLVIVSSKSGSTLEANILEQYFFDRIVQLVGTVEAGRRFIAITDPGSKMQEIAERDGFRRIFFGWPTIGGRYSALSDFGLVPAAIMGLDVETLLDRTEEMVCACMPSVPIEENPGVVLGTVLGVAASAFGRDKLTIVASPGVAAFGAWVEQLVAESTGKDGTGLMPIDQETLAPPDRYDRDRIFVYARLLSAPDAAQDRGVDALAAAGHSVVRIELADLYDLGAEFFRWEIATAVAASILGVHPFDQPDVEESKTATRKLTAEFEAHGTLPVDTPFFTADGIALFADENNTAVLRRLANREATLAGYLGAHLNRLAEGDYFALLAYLEMSEAHRRMLQQIRHAIRDARRVATCLQFGPRFLHSTGQAYKGGPNSGVFLQVTCADAVDLPVPGHPYTFGVVKAAQARGDFQVLAARDRRALRVHLGSDVAAGLDVLGAAVVTALTANRFEMSMR